MIYNDEKYIYLDWNIFKYMKEPRTDKGKTDKQFKELIFKLKKKYKFPFSYAHIRDRANHYSKEHYEKVKQDFEFVDSITDSICVGIHKGELALYRVSMQVCFDDYISKKENNITNISTSFPFSFKVDMEKLDKNHPMYDFLLESNGVMNTKVVDDFLQKMYECIFSDSDRYKKFRNYIDKMDLKDSLYQPYSYNQIKQLNRLLYHLYPFINSFQDDEEQLKKKWAQIAERWFSLNSDSVLKREQLLIQGYTLLDMHPLFREKMKKGKNTLDNIVRDGNHCFYASNARYFVSEDEYTLRKTSFLYDVYNIKTKAVCENDFIKYFEVI